MKEYSSALKCTGLGCIKLGVIATALYGAYKWTTGNVVYLNEFIKEAEEIFQKQNHEPFVPKAINKWIDLLYGEHKSFKTWPKSGKKFFLQHLEFNTPMSAEIILKLLEKAKNQRDSSFEKKAVQFCISAVSSTFSCLSVMKSLTAPLTNKHALSNVMSIVRRCKKKSNAFCDMALEHAASLSIQEKQLSDVSKIAKLLLRRNLRGGEKERNFVEKAATLSLDELEPLAKKRQVCKEAVEKGAKKSALEWTSCYAYANWRDQLKELDRSWAFEREYPQNKERELEGHLKNALSAHAIGIAQLCLSIPHSDTCQNYVSQIFDFLINNDMENEIMRILGNSQSALSSTIPVMLHSWIDLGKWDAAIQFFLNFAKKNPSIDIQSQISILTEALLKSDQAHKTFELLSLHVPLNTQAVLEKAFKNQDEDHLHRIYLLAKSWIAKKDKRYEPYLIWIIEKMFTTKPAFWSDYDSYSHSSFNEVMAKTLATRWILSHNPARFAASELIWDWHLNQKKGSQWDAYSSLVNQHNWKQMIKN